MFLNPNKGKWISRLLPLSVVFRRGRAFSIAAGMAASVVLASPAIAEPFNVVEGILDESIELDPVQKSLVQGTTDPETSMPMLQFSAGSRIAFQPSNHGLNDSKLALTATVRLEEGVFISMSFSDDSNIEARQLGIFVSSNEANYRISGLPVTSDRSIFIQQPVPPGMTMPAGDWVTTLMVIDNEKKTLTVSVDGIEGDPVDFSHVFDTPPSWVTISVASGLGGLAEVRELEISQATD